ncbi:unnamed protein product [Meganyctiphanes norvegica]|uniref:Anion exchange protein n=1 Tax=Meganyctiphanes norvegica TaxID=48144 RepID=A0AAV2PN43_MEGNR
MDGKNDTSFNEPITDKGGQNQDGNKYTFEDIERHHSHSTYQHLPIPLTRRRSRQHRRHHHHRHNKDGNNKEKNEDERPVTPPSQRVQFILGENAAGEDFDMHPLFSEMETLVEMAEGEFEWKETARWVKFEEDVEDGGERWSKPHVATLSLHSLFELRSFLHSGTLILDMDAHSLEEIADLIMDNMTNTGHLPYDAREKFKEALMKKHKHLYEKNKKDKENGGSRLPLIRSLAEIGRNTTSKSVAGFQKAFSFAGGNSNLTVNPEEGLGESNSAGNINRNTSGSNLESKGNVNFMRKIPPGCEASNILVGEVPFLEKPLTAFIRLSKAADLGNLTEVPVPTRFLFIILGPIGGLSRYHEIGRSMATLLADEVFHEVAYKGRNRQHILAGIDEFLDAVTVLPPGEWDPAIRIEPPSIVPSQEKRKKNEKPVEIDEEEEEEKLRKNAGLVRTGRLFGGFINDIKRKIPWYCSDFKDGFAVQSIASFFFLYFACLTPIVTFGGLLGEATNNNIAAIESLVAGLLCGVVYGLFSGQPLTILGSTGPVLVFETIVYDFCRTMEWEYLSFRFWIGLWVALILIILVAIDASAMVCFITRFTEENFATLIAFIFIFKSIEKVAKIGTKYPMETNVDAEKYCNCTSPDEWVFNGTEIEWGSLTETECKEFNGQLIGNGCLHYYPDVFLMSVILFLGTFLISIYLKDFKTATFFRTGVRQFISDFAVIIAILAMTGLDLMVGIHTPKLDVPAKFAPTHPDRTWVIPPFNGNPVWSAAFALLPALLATILIFMDQQITAVIINRKEFKLKKGGGYHLDLFVLAILIAVCSIMGLPWFCAATVLSINHVNSLKLESESAAPGEKPQFLGVRENRVTHILIFLFIGLSVVMTPVLRKIPMPVLFGVFLYMGIASLKGLQFFDRILIMFMPVKYQPDYAFLRQVPLKKVHLYTLIQLFCLGSLWTIKSFPETSILFPLMLVIMIIIRKLLDFVFTQRELKILDDALPEFKRKDRLVKEEESLLDVDINAKDPHGMVTVPLVNGNVLKVPHPSINISEELNKSGVWKDIHGPEIIEKKPASKRKSSHHRKRGSTKDAQNDDETRKLSLMPEGDEIEEEDEGITIKIKSTKYWRRNSSQSVESAV